MDIERVLNSKKKYLSFSKYSLDLMIFKSKLFLLNINRKILILCSFISVLLVIVICINNFFINDVYITERNVLSLAFGGKYSSVLQKPVISVTPLSYLEYTIKTGDSLHSLAKDFNLDEITILNFNSLAAASRIFAGRKIMIPNQDGILCRIDKNNTITSISEKYRIKAEILIKINSMNAGMKLTGVFVPGIHHDSVTKSLLLGEYFRMPVYGRITSYFGFRRDPINHLWIYHKGIDVVNKTNCYVSAAGAGQVIFTGWEWPLGNAVKIRHQNGFVTCYGHLSKITIKKYSQVNAGAVVGIMGNTGRTTGIHLHYEVYQYGKLINPLKVTLR